MIDVVHLITSLETGGAQRMLAKLLAGTDRTRFRSRVVTLVDGGPMAERIRRLGIDVTGLGMRPSRPRPRAIGALTRLLRDSAPDILQTWLWHADLLGALVSRRARVPRLVWNLRNTPIELAPGAPGPRPSLAARWTPRACALVSRRPDAVISNSRAGIDAMTERGWKPQRWCYIPNGFDVDRFRPEAQPAGADSARERVRRLLPGPPDAVRAVVLARFHPMKNHAGMVAAINALGDARLRVACIGNGTDSAEFSALLKGPARSAVLGLGEQRELATLLPGFDFLLLGSHPGEAFPNVLGEALACGIPCVTTPSGDAELIVGEAGWVARSAAPEDLERALGAMLALTSERRRELGALGRSNVCERYSLPGVITAYEALYTELAG